MSRTLKDKNKPKGAMSAYACFVQVIREEHKKKHPGEHIVFSDFSKKCAERWKVMTPKEKKRFDDMAAIDKERYVREMNDYIPPDGVKKAKKRKAVKDPMMPKRPWSAFFFFCDEFRASVREDHLDWKVAEVAKELGRRWEECADKSKYESLAHQDKLRFEEDMNKFRAGTYVPPKKEMRVEASAVASADSVAKAENGAEEEEDDDEAEIEEPEDE